MSKDKVLDELERIRVEIESMIPNRKQSQERQMSGTAKRWLNNEPSFAKPIAKSVYGQPPDKLPL